MPVDPYKPFIFGLRAGDKLENKKINIQLELTLVDFPLRPFEFKDCIFNVSPTFPEDPPLGHPALVFDHCTFKKSLKLNSLKFHRKVIFRSCRFERYVDFTESCFFYGVSFEDCSFDEKVYFERATFGQDFTKLFDDDVDVTPQAKYVRCVLQDALVRLAQTCL